MSAPWREASSLIIAAKCGQSTPDDDVTDFKLLLTKRSGKSSYLANAFCFPGGHIEVADFGAEWWAVFAKLGHSRDSVRGITANIEKPRPAIFAEPLVLNKLDADARADALPADIALRIAAIRETFEETGVLLVRGQQPDISLKEWQQRVHDDATQFVKLFHEYPTMCPDVWSLKEWWNWLTPEALGHKRFDTMFYVCCLDAMPATTGDDNEVSTIEWHSPQYVLKLHADANSFLAPPQVYELARLANFTKYEDLKQFAHNRESRGVSRWCAHITGLKDGAVLALPGDDFYDTVITSSGNQLPTLADVRNKCHTMNRLELRAPVFTPICANLNVPCGHLCPITCELPSDAATALSSQL